jgi:hypothetical protein
LISSSAAHHGGAVFRLLPIFHSTIAHDFQNPVALLNNGDVFLRSFSQLDFGEPVALTMATVSLEESDLPLSGGLTAGTGRYSSLLIVMVSRISNWR